MKAIAVAILTVLVVCCFAQNASAQDVRSDSSNRAWASWKPYQKDTVSKHTKRAKIQRMIARKGKDSAGTRSAGFLSPDRYFEKYRAWSPYVYAADNPLRYSDPSGDTIVATEENGRPSLTTTIQEIGQTQRGRDIVEYLQAMPQTVTISWGDIPRQNVGGDIFQPGGVTQKNVKNELDGGMSLVGAAITIDKETMTHAGTEKMVGIVGEELFHVYQYAKRTEEMYNAERHARINDTPYHLRDFENTARSAANDMVNQYIYLRNNNMLDNSTVVIGSVKP
jgi:hypothetical protein